MERQLRIGVDLDGVVYNLDRSWTDKYNSLYNARLTTEEWTDWNFKNMKLKCGFEPFFAISQLAEVQWTAPLVKDAVIYLRQLSNEGHLICFITAAKRAVIPIKLAKLMQDLPDIPYELHFTKEKHLVHVDVMIDDNPCLVDQWYTMFNLPPLILFTQAYNRHKELPVERRVDVCRGNGWKHVYRIIHEEILGETRDD